MSIGAVGAERQLTNVADGTEDFDAVNMRQLRAAGLVDASGNVLNAVTYDSITQDTISFAGVGGTVLTNVAGGAIDAASTDAVNGAQLYAFGGSLVSALGGGSMLDAYGGIVGPTFNVMGGSFGNVGAALDALNQGIAALDTRVTTIENNGPIGGGTGDPRVDTSGSTPGTVLHGPSNRMLNLSFFKDFAVYNATKLQFRAEVYNVTNTPNFVVPNGQLGNPAFGSISGSGNSIPRQMQFAVKYLF